MSNEVPLAIPRPYKCLLIGGPLHGKCFTVDDVGTGWRENGQLYMLIDADYYSKRAVFGHETAYDQREVELLWNNLQGRGVYLKLLPSCASDECLEFVASIDGNPTQSCEIRLSKLKTTKALAAAIEQQLASGTHVEADHLIQIVPR